MAAACCTLQFLANHTIDLAGLATLYVLGP
jgi:hypothetical protein